VSVVGRLEKLPDLIAYLARQWHTGLLVRQPHGLDFPHQTFPEYHAACYATRKLRTRRQAFNQLFLPEQWWQRWYYTDQPSYLGFLLDRPAEDSRKYRSDQVAAAKYLAGVELCLVNRAPGSRMPDRSPYPGTGFEGAFACAPCTPPGRRDYLGN
jgi:hypothetical protein